MPWCCFCRWRWARRRPQRQPPWLRLQRPRTPQPCRSRAPGPGPTLRCANFLVINYILPRPRLVPDRIRSYCACPTLCAAGRPRTKQMHTAMRRCTKICIAIANCGPSRNAWGFVFLLFCFVGAGRWFPLPQTIPVLIYGVYPPGGEPNGILYTLMGVPAHR